MSERNAPIIPLIASTNFSIASVWRVIARIRRSISVGFNEAFIEKYQGNDDADRGGEKQFE